jgi:hypothetical protein
VGNSVQNIFVFDETKTPPEKVLATTNILLSVMWVSAFNFISLVYEWSRHKMGKTTTPFAMWVSRKRVFFFALMILVSFVVFFSCLPIFLVVYREHC